MNLNAYCHNNPVGYVDPSGHKSKPCAVKEETIDRYAQENGISKREARKKYEELRKKDEYKNMSPEEFQNTITKGKGYKVGDVDEYGKTKKQIKRAEGNRNKKADQYVQAHHPIQNEWAKRALAALGYDENKAPAILLKSASGEAHAKISAAQRMRRALDGGWDTSLIDEFNIGYRELIDAGVSPKDAQKAMKKAYKYFRYELKIKINN